MPKEIITAGMAAEIAGILEVKQWISFPSPSKAMTERPLDELAVYNSKLFLVIAREDHFFDGCRYTLLDLSGNEYVLCPGMSEVRCTGGPVFDIDEIEIVPPDELIKLDPSVRNKISHVEKLANEIKLAGQQVSEEVHQQTAVNLPQRQQRDLPAPTSDLLHKASLL